MRQLIHTWMLCLLCLKVWSGDVSYHIDPILSADEAIIKVTLVTQADPEGHTSLVYFDQAWGEEQLFDCLRSIQVHNKNARIKKVPEQNRIFIKSDPGEELKVTYVIKQDFEGLPEKNDYYRPIINKDYFHLFGHRLFIIPETFYKSNAKQDVSITWEPKPFLVQHNFGTDLSSSFSITRDELLESVIVGGDFRRETILINGITLHLLTRGEWKHFADDELALKLERIIEVQRSFWSDYTDSLYTVTLLPLHSSTGRYLGGTGLAKGFASYCSNSEVSRLDELTSLYYHEIMHHWIGGKIRNQSRTKELWFSEGFTEYFAHLLMKQEGEYTEREWKQKKRDIYSSHKNSEWSEIPNDLVDFSSQAESSAIEKVPYRRGFLYALYLDNLDVRNEDDAGKLKGLMLRILKESDEHTFSNAYFKDLVGQCFGEEESKLFDEYILEGKLIPRSQLF